MLTENSIPPRLKAFLIHLGISLIIFLGLMYLIIYIWYPPPFFSADGGWQGVKIMIGVDLVLGPLLTLAIYNSSKPARQLKFDLCAIAIVQLLALAGGAWVVEKESTRLVTFTYGTFSSLTRRQIDESGVTPEQFEKLKTRRPAMAFVDIPGTREQQLSFTLKPPGGKPAFKHGELYRPMTADRLRKITEFGYDLDAVANASPELQPMITKFLREHGKTSSQVSAFPLYCRYRVVTLVLDKEQGKIIDTLEIGHNQLLETHRNNKRPT